MSSLSDARAALAEAVTSAGIECAAYSPENMNAPGAWIDSVTVDYSQGAGFSFCTSGLASAQIVAVAPRHDRAASRQWLEDIAPAIRSAVEMLPGVLVASLEEPEADIGGTSLPALVLTVRFEIQG